MRMDVKKITASADTITPARNTKLCTVLLDAGAAVAATVEIFDGTQSAGKSVAKLSATAGTSQSIELELLVTSGISATISGTGATAYVYYE